MREWIHDVMHDHSRVNVPPWVGFVSANPAFIPNHLRRHGPTDRLGSRIFAVPVMLSFRYWLYIAFVLTAGFGLGGLDLVRALESPPDSSKLARNDLSEWTRFDETSYGSSQYLTVTLGSGKRLRFEAWFPAYQKIRNELAAQRSPEVLVSSDEHDLVLASEGAKAFQVDLAEGHAAYRRNGLKDGLIMSGIGLAAAIVIFRKGRSKRTA